MSEEIPEYSAEEFLDWLCWMWAQHGERFYPPDETAWECTEEVMEYFEEEYDNEDMLTLELIKAYESEYSEHCRAISTAIIRFSDAKKWGFNPMERAARHHRDLMESSDSSIEPLDWSWWRTES